MLLTEAGRALVGLILCFSAVFGQEKSICVLKGSSVDLPCSVQNPTSSMKWYTAHKNKGIVLKDLAAVQDRVSYNMLHGNNFALTIKDLRENDTNLYCCKETTKPDATCWSNRKALHVADLQVKVIPTSDGNTVTLMCSTSCALAETPAAYIWNKNGEFLYEDWSPWYQQLVSSKEDVTYSCAVKGYEDLKAPEVSVDSVTSTCFNVTYAKGRMCSHKKKSVDESCSITYPRVVQVTPAETNVTQTCNTSCPLTDSQTVYEKQNGNRSSCAVKGFEDVLSAEACTEVNNCWSVNYVSRRICAVEGSSVIISSTYTHPENQEPESKLWYKKEKRRGGEEEFKELNQDAGRVKCHDNKNHHILSINNLKKMDSTEYKFILKTQSGEMKQSDFPGVTLVVTDLEVTISPAVVTKGQNVTLTCSTSCPLNTNYIWYLNSQPLQGNRNKHLLLHQFDSQHEGSYSCGIETGSTHTISSGKTLTMQNVPWKLIAAAAVAGAVLLVVIFLTVYCIKLKRTSGQPPQSGPTENMEQPNLDSLYGNISAQPAEQVEILYSRVHFATKRDPSYSNVQPQDEHVTYATVNRKS